MSESTTGLEITYPHASLLRAIDAAHDALHAGDIDAAHELLHTVGAGQERIACGTNSPALQAIVAEWRKKLEQLMPCGHAIGDLIGGMGAVTKCGACIMARHLKKDTDCENETGYGGSCPYPAVDVAPDLMGRPTRACIHHAPPVPPPEPEWSTDAVRVPAKTGPEGVL